MLADRGAVVLDADVLAREAVEPGTAGLRRRDRPVRRRACVGPTARSTGATLAAIVFADDEARARPRGDRAPGGPAAHRRGGRRATPTPTHVVVVDSPAADRDGRARECVPRRGRRDRARRRTVARLVGAGHGRGRRRARAWPRRCRWRRRRRTPTCCSTTRARSSELEAQVDRLWADLRERALSSRRERDVRFRAVLFDAGETLVHPAPSFPELFARIVHDAGHDRDPDDVLAASARGAPAVQRGRARRRAVDDSRPSARASFWLGVYERMLDALGLPSADGLRDTLYAGFTDLGELRAVRRRRPRRSTRSPATGVTLGIVSNFEAWLDDLLAALGVRERFPVRVISGLEGMEKPDPRIYRAGARASGRRAERGRLRRRQPGVRRRPARGARHVPGADRPARAASASTTASGSPTCATLARRAGGRVTERGSTIASEAERRAADAPRACCRAIREARAGADRRERAHHRGRRGRRRRRRRRRLVRRTSRRCATSSRTLADAGILLRDPETGLVDFPAEREGERVFLCWRLGEETVGVLPRGARRATRTGSRCERGARRSSWSLGADADDPPPGHRGRRRRRRPAVRARRSTDSATALAGGRRALLVGRPTRRGSPTRGPQASAPAVDPVGDRRGRRAAVPRARRERRRRDERPRRVRRADRRVGDRARCSRSRPGCTRSIVDQQRREWTSGRTTRAARRARGSWWSARARSAAPPRARALALGMSVAPRRARSPGATRRSATCSASTGCTTRSPTPTTCSTRCRSPSDPRAVRRGRVRRDAPARPASTTSAAAAPSTRPRSIEALRGGTHRRRGARRLRRRAAARREPPVDDAERDRLAPRLRRRRRVGGARSSRSSSRTCAGSPRASRSRTSSTRARARRRRASGRSEDCRPALAR